jgi:hypothetical protein
MHIRCVGIDPSNAYLDFWQRIYALQKGVSPCSVYGHTKPSRIVYMLSMHVYIEYMVILILCNSTIITY